jgi:hypothetical protein
MHRLRKELVYYVDCSVLLIPYTFCMLLSVGGLFCMHSVMVTKGVTTYEHVSVELDANGV